MYKNISTTKKKLVICQLVWNMVAFVTRIWSELKRAEARENEFWVLNCEVQD